MYPEKAREYLKKAEDCSRSGDSEGWLANMRLGTKLLRERLDALPSGEEITDEELESLSSILDEAVDP
jgi:hypothetical protein